MPRCLQARKTNESRSSNFEEQGRGVFCVFAPDVRFSDMTSTIALTTASSFRILNNSSTYSLQAVSIVTIQVHTIAFTMTHVRQLFRSNRSQGQYVLSGETESKREDVAISTPILRSFCTARDAFGKTAAMTKFACHARFCIHLNSSSQKPHQPARGQPHDRHCRQSHLRQLARDHLWRLE